MALAKAATVFESVIVTGVECGSRWSHASTVDARARASDLLSAASIEPKAVSAIQNKSASLIVAEQLLSELIAPARASAVFIMF
jgi:hypothetical protein